VHAQSACIAQPSVAPAPAAPQPAPEALDDLFARFRADFTFQRARTRFLLPWLSQADDATRSLQARD
jgi:hypothetical protein